MNGAIKYFREHGLKKSKKHLLDIREAANQVSWVHSLEGFSQDLKRLVESHGLVERFDDLGCAKAWVCDLDADWPYQVKGSDNKFFKWQLEQAIADVESCKESFHER